MTNGTILYPVAKFHKFLHAAPIFRPIKRGARRMGLEYVHTSSDGEKSLMLRLFWELDISDQDLLTALVAMCVSATDSTVISSTPEQEGNKILRGKLLLDGEVANMPAIAVHTTTYALLIELGRTTGAENYRWLDKALDRLSAVTIKYIDRSVTQVFNLLSYCVGTEGGISICINPYSATAILGSNGGYVLIHRQERSQLKTQAARALHAKLCGLVDTKSSRTIRVKTLADKIYGDSRGKGTTTTITKAALEINMLLDWSCVVTGRGAHATIKITRSATSQPCSA